MPTFDFGIAQGLSQVTVEKTSAAMQVSETNPMVGLEGRTSLLISLSGALKASQEFFGVDGRPGNIIGELQFEFRARSSVYTCPDFLDKEARVRNGKTIVPLAAIWHVLIDGLNPIWPSRLSLGGVSLGDVWPCTVLGRERPGEEANDLVPFHKLTQWLTYSSIEVLQKVLKWEIEGVEEMTGLPEYRNGKSASTSSR